MTTAVLVDCSLQEQEYEGTQLKPPNGNKEKDDDCFLPPDDCNDNNRKVHPEADGYYNERINNYDAKTQLIPSESVTHFDNKLSLSVPTTQQLGFIGQSQ